jgi:serine/threonine protein kinase
MTSPIRCPSEAFSLSGQETCTPCSARDADAAQCVEASQLLTYIIVGSVGFLVIANALFFLRHVRQVLLSNASKSAWGCWLVLAVLTGPLVWIIWFVFFKGRADKVSMKTLLLSDSQDDSHISLPMAHTSLLGFEIVSSRDVKINMHVPEQRGGGGVVRQAMWHGRTVAIKKPFFDGTMSDHDKKKFVKELEIQARLRHPNCVAVFAVCTEAQDVFILMEWMHGGSLHSQLANTRRDQVALKQSGVAGSGTALTAHTRLSIAREICDGLQYMHSKGMIHGDIKSLNILLGKDKTAKLCDFGLATMQLSATALVSSSTGGTLAWSAPEIVLHGEHTSFKTDVYALGVVLWELLTCMQPFEGLKAPQIMGLLNEKQRPPIPSPLPAGFSDAYVAIMSRCWSDDPSQRPSAAEVHRCMISLDKSTQANEPVVLYPEGHTWSNSARLGETSILRCLSRALPTPCCRLMLQSIVKEAERHDAFHSVIRLAASCKLLPLEAQSIFVYTADAEASKSISICPTHGPPFKTYNAVLRDGVGQNVAMWRDYSFLLYNALLKLPSLACTVYRGLNVPLTDVSHLYWKGGFVWFRSPTSTTTDKKKTMKQFGVGSSGLAGTFMELRVRNAKAIEEFSLFPQECERLIPHNTCFQVLGALSAADARILEGFASMPANVDLVILEEVTLHLRIYCNFCEALLLRLAADDVILLTFFLVVLQVIQDTPLYHSALMLTSQHGHKEHMRTVSRN